MVGVATQPRGPGLPHQRWRLEETGETPLACVQSARHDLVEKPSQRLHQDVDRSGDEYGAVPSRPVLPHPPDRPWIGAAQQRVAEPVVDQTAQCHLVDTCVATQEGAQKLATVTPFGGEVARQPA